MFPPVQEILAAERKNGGGGMEFLESSKKKKNYMTTPKLMITFASNSLKAYSIIDWAVESCTKAAVIIRERKNPTEMNPGMNLRDPEGHGNDCPWFYARQFVFDF